MKNTKEKILNERLIKKDKEIEELKKRLTKTQDELDLARLSKEMIKAKADEMIETCEKTMIVLNESLEEIDKLKKEYSKKIEEIKKIQVDQKKDYKNLIKKIMKRK